MTLVRFLPNSDLKKKRKLPEVQEVEEGEVVPLKGGKQQKTVREKMGSSMERKEDSLVANMC